MSGEAISDSTPPQRAPKPVGAAFAILFIIAACLAAGVVWMASAGPDIEGEIGGPLSIVITGLVVNAGLICLLGGLVIRRILVVMRSREAGSRLHLRYMSLFALAAAVPAVVVAFFFGGLLNRGVEGWFSAPVETVVENHADLARLVVDGQEERLSAEIGLTSLDLETYIDVLREDPQSYAVLLQQLLDEHDFRAIRVINANSEIITEAATPEAQPYVPPSATTLVDANAGQDAELLEMNADADMALILFRLSGSPAAYALVEAPMPPGLLTILNESETAVLRYRAVADGRNTVQSVFLFIYTETALLVLLGAVWLGMASASSISGPIARLIAASNKVASGNLKARVPTDSGYEEINLLSSSFNQMTDDLDHQTSALMGARAEAENRRQFIETVLSGVSAGVLGLNPDGKVSVCNAQALHLLGADESTAIGQPIQDVAPELAPIVERALNSVGDAEGEVDVLRDGEARRLRVRASGGMNDGLVLTFDDITRLVSAQRNAAWRDVARRIAHEIKNPLTPIQLSAERLRRKYRQDVTSDLETFDRCTETIVRQVGDIGRMVDEFSSFARMPAPKFLPVDGSELLREAVFARRVANPDIDIVLEDSLGDDAQILCDERMLAQALTNILKNASEAVEARMHAKPGKPGRIVARARSDAETIIIEVEDNGVGLPEADRERLTEPYVTTRDKGTGLGLAIVRRILEDHDGSLTLKDAANGGALVTMTLPRTRGLEPPQEQTETQTTEA